MAVKILDIVSGRPWHSRKKCAMSEQNPKKPEYWPHYNPRRTDVENVGSRPNVHSRVLDWHEGTRHADRHLLTEGFARVCDLRPTEPWRGAIAWHEMCFRCRFWCISGNAKAGVGWPWTPAIVRIQCVRWRRSSWEGLNESTKPLRTTHTLSVVPMTAVACASLQPCPNRFAARKIPGWILASRLQGWRTWWRGVYACLFSTGTAIKQ